MNNKTIYLKNYKIPVYNVENLDLEFELFYNKTIVISTTNYFKNKKSKEENYLELNGENLKLISIFLDNKKLEKKDFNINSDGNLLINNTPNKFNLKIVTEIHPETNTTLEGLYISSDIFCTQCEPQGFRRMTYYQDRPDVMTRFTTKITADKVKYPVLLSNGNKIDSGNLENNRHFVVWEDPFKKPAYLFALVAGNLEYIEDFFITSSGKKIILRIFTESHNIKKCDFAMSSLKKAMKWDEDRFGLEYDLDLFMIVAVDDFNSGAMENKGLNIFNSKLVFATPESATDNDYIYIERVVAHEYFHNWTGDRVTCRDWFQLSLKEGLTVFRDSEFTADMHSRSVKRIDDVRYLRNYQFREDASPMAHPIRPDFFEEISNFYTVTVYEKGSEVIGMYQTILGVDGFRKGMDLYFKRHDGEAVTTENFLSAMGDANNKDLSQFQTWYNQAGTPIVKAKSEYNKEKKIYTIHFEQSCPDTPESNNKKPFIIPVKLGLLNKNNGEEINLEQDFIILTKFKQSFTFENIEEVIPSLFRGFSAPIKLDYNYNYKDYAFLMENDTDSFNKFEASQNFAKDIIVEIYKSGKKEINIDYIYAIKAILNDKTLDNAFKAEILNLPSELEIGDIIGNGIIPTKINEIREYFILTMSKELENEFKSIYDELNIDREYNIDSTDIGNRRLKNICLMYISYISGPKIAYSQYINANNMTDKLASLSCLKDIDCDEKEKALNDFYLEWKGNNNVIDKWFTIQASSKLENTLDIVIDLSQHELFDIKNPNKVRALFNSFANLNPAIFNRLDGAGYKFIANKVIELDKINPMIASRLAKTLINWKCLEESLSIKLKNELIKINNIKDLSKDLREVITKALI